MDESEESRKGRRTWLVVVVGLGMLALGARYVFPGADLEHLGVVLTTLAAALWAREASPLGLSARRVALATVGLALLGGMAVHLLAR
jgi:hypothetical protein